MKIAYLARRPIPSVHAHAVQIVKMCEAFGNQGHEVGLFAVRGDDEPASIFSRYGVGQVFDILMHPRRLKHLKKPRFVAWLMRQPFLRQADAYFGRDITSLAAAARLGKPVIYEAHAIPRVNSTRWRLLSRLFARDNFSHLVCVTSTLAEMHRQQFPALAHKPVLVVPNGAADIPDGPALGRWLGRAGAVQVGFVGRPFPGKGIEMMVAAARDLPDIDFHIVGADRSDLIWVGGTLPRNLHFHGYQPHAVIGSYFDRFDIAVAPYGVRVMNASGVESAAITCPLKLLEYMAAGLPSIVSSLPGLCDLVDGDGEGVTILFPPNDQAAFNQALSRLAGDPRLRRDMGKAARARYLERHTMQARANTVLADLASRLDR